MCEVAPGAVRPTYREFQSALLSPALAKLLENSSRAEPSTMGRIYAAVRRLQAMPEFKSVAESVRALRERYAARTSDGQPMLDAQGMPVMLTPEHNRLFEFSQAMEELLGTAFDVSVPVTRLDLDAARAMDLNAGDMLALAPFFEFEVPEG